MEKAMENLKKYLSLPPLLSAAQLCGTPSPPDGRCLMILAASIRSALSEKLKEATKPEITTPTSIKTNTRSSAPASSPTEDVVAAALAGRVMSPHSSRVPTNLFASFDKEEEEEVAKDEEEFDESNPTNLFFSPTSDKKHGLQGVTSQSPPPPKAQASASPSSPTQNDNAQPTFPSPPNSANKNTGDAEATSPEGNKENYPFSCVYFGCRAGLQKGYLCTRHLKEEDKIRGNRGLDAHSPNVLFKLVSTSTKPSPNSKNKTAYYHFEVMTFQKGKKPLCGAYEARFKDFDSLRKRIKEEYKANPKWAHVVPDFPIFPSKGSKFLTDHFSQDFLEKRLRNLQEWLLRMSGVLYMTQSSEFLDFAGLKLVKGATDSEHTWEVKDGILPKSDTLPKRIVEERSGSSIGASAGA
eukprot:g54955.t1